MKPIYETSYDYGRTWQETTWAKLWDELVHQFGTSARIFAEKLEKKEHVKNNNFVARKTF